MLHKPHPGRISVTVRDVVVKENSATLRPAASGTAASTGTWERDIRRCVDLD